MRTWPVRSCIRAGRSVRDVVLLEFVEGEITLWTFSGCNGPARPPISPSAQSKVAIRCFAVGQGRSKSGCDPATGRKAGDDDDGPRSQTSRQRCPTVVGLSHLCLAWALLDVKPPHNCQSLPVGCVECANGMPHALMKPLLPASVYRHGMALLVRVEKQGCHPSMCQSKHVPDDPDEVPPRIVCRQR